MKPPITFEDYQALVKALVERDKQIERLKERISTLATNDGAKIAALEAENAKLKEEKTECNEGNLSKQD